MTTMTTMTMMTALKRTMTARNDIEIRKAEVLSADATAQSPQSAESKGPALGGAATAAVLRSTANWAEVMRMAVRGH